MAKTYKQKGAGGFCSKPICSTNSSTVETSGTTSASGNAAAKPATRPELRFRDITPATYVAIDYNNTNIYGIKVYQEKDLMLVNRKSLYVNIKPDSRNDYASLRGVPVTIQELSNSNVFLNRDVIEIHPQLALYMFNNTNYSPLLTQCFGGMYDAGFIDNMVREEVATEVQARTSRLMSFLTPTATQYAVSRLKYKRLQAKMMYYVLCHYAYIYMLKTGIRYTCTQSTSTLEQESRARDFLTCTQMQQMEIAIQLLKDNRITLNKIVEDTQAMRDSVRTIGRESVGSKVLNSTFGISMYNNKEIVAFLQEFEANHAAAEGGKRRRKTRRSNKKKRITRRIKLVRK
jgi:hypothetical protein